MNDNSTMKSPEGTKEFETKLDLLKKEFDAVQAGIGSYGDVQFKIKGWAITIFSAWTLFALEKRRPDVLVACAVPILLFWMLDAFYKSLQQVYIERSQEIENLINHLFDTDPPLLREHRVFDLERRLKDLAELRWRPLVARLVMNGLRFQIALLYLVMLLFVLVIGLSGWIT